MTNGSPSAPTSRARTPRLAPLKEITLSRIRIMVREPEVVFWVFLFPVLLALGLGLAFSDPTAEVRVVVVEAVSSGGQDGVPDEIIAVLEAHPELELRIVEVGEAELALSRGEVDLWLGGEDGRTARFDPTRAEGRQARSLVELAFHRGAGDDALLRDEPIEQRGRRYIDWLIPGLIGFNLMSTGLWAMGFYLTQMRESRQLKRLAATPMRRSDFLLGQIVARFAFLVLEVPLIVIFAWLAFGVVVVGDLLSLTLVILVGAACFSAFGLLAACRARTVEAASGIINVILLPMLVVSGVFFSPSRFPDAAQPFIRALPLTALNDALRGVYNDGLSIAGVGGEVAIVSVWTVVIFLLALRFFRWQ